MSGGRGRTETTGKEAETNICQLYLSLLVTAGRHLGIREEQPKESKRMAVRTRERMVSTRDALGRWKQAWQMVGTSICCYCLRLIKRDWTTQKRRVGTLTLGPPNVQGVPSNFSSTHSLKREMQTAPEASILHSHPLLPLTWLWDLSKSLARRVVQWKNGLTPETELQRPLFLPKEFSPAGSSIVTQPQGCSLPSFSVNIWSIIGEESLFTRALSMQLLIYLVSLHILFCGILEAGRRKAQKESKQAKQ